MADNSSGFSWYRSYFTTFSSFLVYLIDLGYSREVFLRIAGWDRKQGYFALLANQMRDNCSKGPLIGIQFVDLVLSRTKITSLFSIVIESEVLKGI